MDVDNVSCGGGTSVEIAEPSKLTGRNTEKMPAFTAVDKDQFRRIIRRNIVLPLAMGLLTAVVFVALVELLIRVGAINRFIVPMPSDIIAAFPDRKSVV